MELKDVVLSTLAELEDNEAVKQELNNTVEDNINVINQEKIDTSYKKEQKDDKPANDELHFLTSVRERLLVLFEGFQAPNNKEIEAKIDMTLNFLEYTLATIDKRLEKIQKGDI
jgi:septum formation inhibitor MinC